MKKITLPPLNLVATTFIFLSGLLPIHSVTADTEIVPAISELLNDGKDYVVEKGAQKLKDFIESDLNGQFKVRSYEANLLVGKTLVAKDVEITIPLDKNVEVFIVAEKLEVDVSLSLFLKEIVKYSHEKTDLVVNLDKAKIYIRSNKSKKLGIFEKPANPDKKTDSNENPAAKYKINFALNDVLVFVDPFDNIKAKLPLVNFKSGNMILDHGDLKVTSNGLLNVPYAFKSGLPVTLGIENKNKGFQEFVFKLNGTFIAAQGIFNFAATKNNHWDFSGSVPSFKKLCPYLLGFDCAALPEKMPIDHIRIVTSMSFENMAFTIKGRLTDFFEAGFSGQGNYHTPTQIISLNDVDLDFRMPIKEGGLINQVNLSMANATGTFNLGKGKIFIKPSVMKLDLNLVNRAISAINITGTCEGTLNLANQIIEDLSIIGSSNFGKFDFAGSLDLIRLNFVGSFTKTFDNVGSLNVLMETGSDPIFPNGGKATFVASRILFPITDPIKVATVARIEFEGDGIEYETRNFSGIPATSDKVRRQGPHFAEIATLAGILKISESYIFRKNLDLQIKGLVNLVDDSVDLKVKAHLLKSIDNIINTVNVFGLLLKLKLDFFNNLADADITVKGPLSKPSITWGPFR